MTMTPKLLTVEDLAERWGVSASTAWDRAISRIPGVWLGRGEYSPAKAGPKTVRFRPAAVEAFEAEAEIRLGKPTPEAETTPIPAGTIAGWDGVVRGRKKKAKAR